MAMQTFRSDGTVRRKPFTWSYSALKSFEQCGLKHLETNINKTYQDRGAQLDWGDAVHKEAARIVPTGAEPGDNYKMLGKWVQEMQDGKPILAEYKMAFTRDFAPCPYFDDKVWWRGVADVLKIRGRVALASDWKTGKIDEDSVQLALMAQGVFAHFPEVEKIRTEFIWLKDDAFSREDFSRNDMPNLWKLLLPRVDRMEQAFLSQNYLPKPSGLCKKHCKVVSCPHHGK